MGSRNNNNVLIFVVATLLAFGIGSGLGISMGIAGDDFSIDEENNTPILVDVTNNISEYEKRYDDYYDNEKDIIYTNDTNGVKYTPDTNIEYNTIDNNDDY